MIATLVNEAAAKLAAAGVASPRHDAELLLSHILGVERRGLRSTAEATAGDITAYETLVSRRAAREPLQHLTGITTFRYVELTVGPGVFVPRPETELIAGWAIEQLNLLQDPVVVDLCTGSGAIAAAIADEAPHARVSAIELDEVAFGYAQRNLSGAAVDLRRGDMADAFPELDGLADVVVANPPYIPLEAWESVETEVRDHDPALALWSGQDGLDAVRVVADTASRLLRPGGVAGCEHADVQAESAPAVFATTGHWSAIQDHHDLVGRPRFVTAARVPRMS